ncbi:MAG TPA: lipopolysaccharide heptosyltransferase II [Vicinamibacterales bacterium]
MPRLVVRVPNWLGDIVMALPAIAAIRAAHPGAHLALAGPAAFAPFCAAIAGVDHVVGLTGKGIRALGTHARQLAEGRFDRAILLTNSFASALAVKRAGIPERWGYRRDLRGPLLTRAVRPTRPSGESRHHSRYYLRLVEALGIPAVAGEWTVTPPDDALSRADALLAEAGYTGGEPLVAFAPGAAYGYAKRWPPGRVAEAIAALTADGVRVAIVGAASDRPTARAIQSALVPRRPSVPVVDLVGRTDLLALMGVLARSRVVVSNDSGAMHVASAVGRPVVAVFGPTDERATAPLGTHAIVRHDVWCRPCLLRECPIDHRCLRGVTAGQVVEAVRTQLARNGGATQT